MSNIIKRKYKEYDDMYETLEISPYNAAYDYYAAGWATALKTFKANILNELSKKNPATSSNFMAIVDEAIGKSL